MNEVLESGGVFAQFALKLAWLEPKGYGAGPIRRATRFQSSIQAVGDRNKPRWSVERLTVGFDRVQGIRSNTRLQDGIIQILTGER